jgi:hypothetical protein
MKLFSLPGLGWDETENGIGHSGGTRVFMPRNNTTSSVYQNWSVHSRQQSNKKLYFLRPNNSGHYMDLPIEVLLLSSGIHGPCWTRLVSHADLARYIPLLIPPPRTPRWRSLSKEWTVSQATKFVYLFWVDLAGGDLRLRKAASASNISPQMTLQLGWPAITDQQQPRRISYSLHHQFPVVMGRFCLSKNCPNLG